MENVGTLTLRYAINEPDMATTKGGTMPYAGGVMTYQHKNLGDCLYKAAHRKGTHHGAGRK